MLTDSAQTSSPWRLDPGQLTKPMRLVDLDSSHQAHLSPPTDYCNLTAHHHHCHQLDPIPATAHLARADQEPNQPSQAILKQLAEQLGPSNDSTLDNLHLKTSILNTGHSLLNILIGAIYPTWFSTPLTCLLTAIGSTGAYLIAKTARPIIIILIPRPLQLIQRAIDPFRIKGTTNQFKTAELSSYLLIARFLPIVPYAALNLTCGVLELPLLPFFWTLLVGSLPYNLLTTQLGDILRTASESSDHNVGLNEICSKEWISDQGGRRNTIDSVSESEDLENRLLILDHSSSYHHLHQQPHLIESSASSTDYEEYDLSSNTSDSSSTDELVIQFNPTPRSSSSSSIISKSTSPTLLSSTKLNGLKIIDHHHHLSIVQAPPPSRKLATLNPSPSLNNNNNINCSTFV
ncbi:hypothetical protein PSTT_03245 [Puccinia striiformis]|uniref:VTT domain-containing protein n=1 Tax=Puccinia striiformis TaxID=27350 RepID=A0A2S4VWY6_9BASI|nr:hypothetical protein PSTT_03245 [Puccinia striiformis]